MKVKTHLPEPLSRTWLHIIWTTQDQIARIKFERRNKLFLYLRNYAEEEKIYLDVVNGMADHVHVLLLLNPRSSLTEIVGKLKRAAEQYLEEENLWEKAFRAYSLSPGNLPHVRRQIRRQAKMHQRISLEQELWDLEPRGFRQECQAIGEVIGKRIG